MADFLKKFKNFVLGKKEAESVISHVKSFNAATTAYLDVLEQDLNQKKKKATGIRVLLNKLRPNQKIPNSPHNLNIQLIDINDTKITQKGKGSYSKQMEWEKKLRNMRNDNKGFIV